MTPAEKRAGARGDWAARLVTGTDPGEEAPHELTPEEAWLAVGQLTRSLWLLTGHSVHVVPRAQWPARLFQPGEVRDDGSEPR